MFPTRRLTTAQALVAFLAAQGVERDGAHWPSFAGVYGIFGHGNVAGLGEALEAVPTLPYRQARNEQAMVHAFARQHRRLRAFACTSSIGPGATNMLTGAATATINRIPVLLLPGDLFATRRVAPVLQQREPPDTQDVPVNDCFRPVSRYWDRINRPEQLVAAPGGVVRRTAAIDSATMFVEARGEGRTARRIHHLLPPAAAAGRLLAFEVYTPGGNWSSFPPHKHDTDDPPRESFLEELYYYRFARPSGFACQRVYSADRSLDVTLAVGDGDLVLDPRGYHVVAAVPSYDCYYLNIMAGPIRVALHRRPGARVAHGLGPCATDRLPGPRSGGPDGVETSIPLRPLERMAATTPIAYWNDSCAVDELADPIVHGAVGAAQFRAELWKEAGLPG